MFKPFTREHAEKLVERFPLLGAVKRIADYHEENLIEHWKSTPSHTAMLNTAKKLGIDIATVDTKSKEFLEQTKMHPELVGALLFDGLKGSTFASYVWKILRGQGYFENDYPKNKNAVLPVELWSNNSIHGEKDSSAGWLQENAFTNPRGFIIAGVLDDANDYAGYRYILSDLPVSELVERLKVLTTEWQSAARATGFDFDNETQTGIFDFKCLEVAWNAAPNDLREEYKKTVRQLVKEVWEYHKEKLKPSISVKTIFPNELVIPTDKISQKAFSGVLNGGVTFPIAQERIGSKKEITTLISIDFDDLGENVVLTGKKELDAFDREVHDAIVSLYVGGNEYVTPQMIYKTLVGDKNAKITDGNIGLINDSITKCMFTRVNLDATDDAKAYGFEKLTYQGALLAAEKVTAKLNGQTMETVRLLRSPILYEYAEKKNQIGRIDVKLLATPINKTSDILTLQGYLHRRILAMKNPKSKISKNILYKTIFEQRKVEDDRTQKDKKTKIRAAVRKILDYWKSQNFIKNYQEEKRGSEFYSVNITV